MRRVLALLAVVAALAALSVAAPVAAQPSPDNGGDVVGGDPVAPGGAPYQVAIVMSPDFFGGDPLLNQYCGGSLIAPDVVLTAAHCVQAEGDLTDFPIFGVLAGIEDLEAAEASDLIPIDAASVYPGFWNEWEEETGVADLAVLHLADEVTVGTPIGLVQPGQEALWDAGSPATVTGWGNMSGDPHVPNYATDLQVGEVNVVDDQDCYEAYRQHARVELDMEVQLCAAAPGVDACDGDSGGPLVVDDGGTPVQVGIVASGIGCAEPLYAGVYTRLAPFVPILEAIVAHPFSDVGFDHQFLWEISWLSSEGIAEGYADGTYRAARSVSRGAMAAYLYRLAGEPAFSPPSSATFDDVDPAHPFFAEVEWLVAEGIAEGYADGSYRPAAPVSRATMAAYLYRFAGEPAVAPVSWFDDVSESHPFFAEISWVAENGIAQGTFVEDADSFRIVFRPAQATSRQAMAAFLQRFDALEP